VQAASGEMDDCKRADKRMMKHPGGFSTSANHISVRERCTKAWFLPFTQEADCKNLTKGDFIFSEMRNAKLTKPVCADNLFTSYLFIQSCEFNFCAKWECLIKRNKHISEETDFKTCKVRPAGTSSYAIQSCSHNFFDAHQGIYSINVFPS